MKKNVARCLLIVMVLSWQLIAHVAFAKATTLDVGTVNQSSILLSSYLGVLEDSTGVLTLAEVQKEDVAQRFQTDLSANKPLNMSYTSSAYWLRLELENSSDKPVERVLGVDHPLLANLDFYFQTDNQHYETVHTGYLQPFENRSYQSRIFAFPISLPAHSQHTLYLRVQTPNAMILPILLWQPSDFHIDERNDYSIQALYFGLVIAIGLLNLVFALALKEFDYLLYVCMIIFVALTMIANRGFGSEFLWHSSPWLTRILPPLSFGALALVSQLFFIRRILDTPTLAPKIDDALKLLIGIHLLTPIVLAFTFHLAKFIPVSFAISALLILIVSVIGMRKGKRNAYFLFAAFFLLAIGVITNGLLVLAIIPINIFTLYSTQIGSALELLVFTFLLIDRYQIIREEKQKNIIALLEAKDENDLLNRQVNQMQKLESLSRLTSGIAHDFNNILTGILGYNELNKFSAEDIQNDEALKMDILNNANQVEKAGYRAVDLIKKMMTYSRQDTHKTEMDVKPTQEVINEVVDMLRPALTSRINLQVVFDCEQTIQIDAIDLHQILTNLTVNARDALKEHGGGVITIALKTAPNVSAHCVACAEMIQGDFIELRVSDNGTGIDSTIINRIFDPFFTTKKIGEGTGLGLSTVIGMVRSSHGHVVIDSTMNEENHGTTFRLLFPSQLENA
ncbi:MAG: 7TM-DISM domain-containing protein [Methylococcaceae bacterium]